MTDMFRGFPRSLEDGYTQLPNKWFEICQGIDNLAELKVVLYVIRHTWGFRDEDGEHEEMKAITTDEFAYGRKYRDGSRQDRGTGLGLTSVKEGLKRAITHHYLVCETDDSDLARIEKSYGLNFLDEDENLDGQNPTTDSQNVTSNNLNPASGSHESDYRSEKETLETNSSKETVRNIAHSEFFDEIMEYIKKKEELTYYELERFLHRFMRVRGKQDLYFSDTKNIFSWTGVSAEFCKIFAEIQEEGYIVFKPCSEDLYNKGRKPNLPVIHSRLKNPDEKHWHPMLIIYKPLSK